MHATLILNADAMPINLLPISAVSWEEAIKNIWVGDSEVLHYYDDWEVRSPSITMRVPAVTILKKQVQVKRNLRLSVGAPSSSLIFLRDGYQCQYCMNVFAVGQLTVDHVLPKKFGGRTNWLNVSSACSNCNNKRGHDMKIQPKTKPFRPTYQHLVKMMRRFPIVMAHQSWNFYLGWSEERVRFIDPREKPKLLSTDKQYFNPVTGFHESCGKEELFPDTKAKWQVIN